MKKRSNPSTSRKNKTAVKKTSGSLKRKKTKSAKDSRDEDARRKRKRKSEPLRGSDGRFKAKRSVGKGPVSPRHPKRKPPLPPKRKPVKKAGPSRKTGRKKAPPKGYRLGESKRFVEPYERVGYTFRVEALAQLSTKYEGVSFDPEVFAKRKPREEEVALQVFHTPFAATEAEAFEYFKERIAIMRAYGDIQFLEISLWKVSGEGPMKEKKWDLIETFDEPEDAIEQFEG